MSNISVIICTHNPRPDYLRRVLDALKDQTLSKERWELLLIDNASKEPLSKAWDLSWHPQGQHVREETLGLSYARLCGISQSQAKILVFVDDDNVLAPNFLETTVELAEQWPIIGAWSGNVHLEFEVSPPSRLKPYFTPYLAQRKVTRDLWGNNVPEIDLPWGAGMCVLRQVAIAYLDLVQNNKAHLGLGRSGTSMLGGEDLDLALRTKDLGLGTALFAKLSLIHLIPAKRLTDDYILKAIHGSRISHLIGIALEGKPLPSPGRLGRLVDAIRYWKLSRFERQAYRALKQAHIDAVKYLSENGINTTRKQVSG